EHRDAADHMVTLVAPEPDTLERRADRSKKRRLLGGIPDHDAVADTAQLETQDAGELRHVRVVEHVLAGAEIAALLRGGEEQPHPQLRRGRDGQPLDQLEQEADGGGVVVWAGTAAHRVVMRGEAARTGAG